MPKRKNEPLGKVKFTTECYWCGKWYYYTKRVCPKCKKKNQDLDEKEDFFNPFYNNTEY